MKQRRLGNSDLFISEIGLGCMSLGTDESTAISIVHEALDKGINFMDTADLYDEGRNEELVGKAIKGHRHEVILATKVGNRRVPAQEGWVWDPSKSYILSAVKESLKRLGTDYIDLYQLHGGTIEDPIEETIEAFEQLKKEGWIRHYGISSIRPNVIREYVSRSNIVSVMSQYSMLDRRPEEEVLDLLKGHNVSLIARGPLAKGILTSSGEKKLGEDYLDYSPDELRETREKIVNLTNDSCTLGQTALRYVLDEPAVATAIPGASDLEQLRQNVSASGVPPLTLEVRAEIQAITKANTYTSHR